MTRGQSRPWPGTAALMLLFTAPAAAQFPRVGIIDFYGVKTVTERRIAQALRIRVGDSITRAPAEAERRVARVSGVVRANVSLVCCEEGRSILYVGIQERDAPILEFHPAPEGKVDLPNEIITDAMAFEQTFMDAVRRGDAEDDGSQGHSLMRDSASRAIQQRFVTHAATSLPLLRDVLRRSSDGRYRAVAAQIIAYAANKQEVVADLALAARDPDERVRNNAVRALILIAQLAQRRPDLGIRVPYRPFVDLLNSIVWTDRNKASGALFQLTRSRDAAVLATIREEALASLSDMARWQAPGHAMAGFVLLGRIGGWTEEEIFAMWERREVERVVEAAQRR